MLEHPWTELQLLIKEKWLTQKAFASILWKKVSEVNELLKWKRNITIQRDYLLHQHLWTPIKYWILKQIDYDYSLLDIEEIDNLPSWTTVRPAELGEDPNWEVDESNIKESSLQTSQNDNMTETSHSESEGRENPSNITPMDFSLQSEWQEKSKDETQVIPLDKGDNAKSREFEKTQETPTKNLDSKDDEDFQNRVKIFRSF